MGVTEILFLVALTALAAALIWLECISGTWTEREQLSPLAFYTPPGSFPVFFPVMVRAQNPKTLLLRKRETLQVWATQKVA